MDALEGIYNATLPTLADGAQVEIQLDSSGAQWVRLVGSSSTSRLLSSAATTNATSVKISSGTVTQLNGYNAAATPRFLKFYDKASAPTVGTDTPRMTLYLPAGMAFVFDCADFYAAGIAYAITGAAADADTTAIAVGDILCLNVDYR